MTEEPLSVDRVDIVRAPGFGTGGFPVEELCTGVNVVHGPNASGKTTVARATQWLLWPDESGDTASIIGQVSLNGEAWRVELDRGRVSYQRDGQEANGPTLPPASHRDRYHLSLHDLLQHETRDESFARAIQRESAGGYDLSAAQDALGFDDSPSTRGKGVVKDAEAAVTSWREATSEIEALRDEQQRLPRLQTELAAAERARDRVALLEQAITYAGARDELADAEADLEAFPGELERIDGDEAGTVDALDERLEEWENRKAEAEATVTRAEAEIADADLPDEGVPNGVIDRLKSRRDDLDSLEAKKRDHEATLADAEERQARALDDIPMAVREDALAALDADAWSDVSEFAQRAETVRAERAARDAVESWLSGDTPSDDELTSLERGRQALESWLANPAAGALDVGKKAFVLAIVSAASLAIAGVALGALVQPAFYLFLAVAVGLLWYGKRVRDDSRDEAYARDTHRESMEQLELEPPAAWEESAVRDRLFELYDGMADHRLAEQREQRRAALTDHIADLERREEALEERRSKLREGLGAAPETSDTALTAIVDGLRRWQAAHERVRGLQAKLDTVEEQLETVREELRDDLDPYGYDDITDAADATGDIRDLEDRADTHEQAQQAIERGEDTIAEADGKIDVLETERDEIFASCGLEPGDDDRLRQLCEQAEAYEDAVGRVERCTHLATNAEADLEAVPGYEAALKQQSVPELKREKRDAEETADGYDEIHGQITKIETRIDEARRDTKVEDALTGKQRALNALAEQLDEDCASLVGDALIDHAQSATSEASRPEVFGRARDILARITRGRYRLDLDDEGHTFRAYDTVSEKGFTLDELSSATRLQVLLAVRVAFVESQERGVRLPLILDETLANTDDGKAEVIIDAMIELAREGRQVFYFTAQGDEVARWLSALETTDDVDHELVDLAGVRELDRQVAVPELEEIPVRSPSLPDPTAQDHTSYGSAIDVPPFNPRTGAGDTHLWYVVDDVALLHRLLDLGISQWGQLDTLLTQTGGDVITDDPAVLAALRRDGAALEEFIRSWSKGRGKRVDRQALENSGAVSGHFIDEVTDLADAVGGDATRIIERLRDGDVDRFRRGKMNDLEEFFEDQGYIEPMDPLEPSQIRVRVMDSLVSAGLERDPAKERTDTLLNRVTT